MKWTRVAIALSINVITGCDGSSAVGPSSRVIPPAPGPLPTANVFSFASETGDWIGAGRTRRFDSAGDYFAAVSFCQNNRLEAFLHAADGLQWHLSFAAPGGRPLRVGSYEGAGSGVSYPRSVPQMSISGEARACNSSSGRFDVEEAEFAVGGRIVRFHARFEHSCTERAAKMSGEILLVNPELYNLATGCS